MKDFDIAQTGITHLSFSAVRDYLVDRRNFRKRWIDHDFSQTPELCLIEGSAFHAGVANYWDQIKAGAETPDIETMRECAKRIIEIEYYKAKEPIKVRIAKADIGEYEKMGCEIEETVKEGKGGRKTTTYKAAHTVESILKGIVDNLANYTVERDQDAYKPELIEQTFIATTKDHETGIDNPWPLKMRIDMVALTNETNRVIVDHKYNGKDPEVDEEGNAVATPAMILQAAAYVSASHAIKETLGLTEGKLTTVIFDIFNKKTGTMTPVLIETGDKELTAWSRIYTTVQRELWQAYSTGDFDKNFLPNPDAMFNSDGWDEFMKDIDYSLEGKKRPENENKQDDFEAYDL